MARVWQIFQECGWPSWVCLLTGMLAFALSIVALAVAVVRGNAAVVLSWAALAVALVPSGVGAAGMARGRARVAEVLASVPLEASQRERIRELGNQEAASCVVVGGTLTVPSLLLAVAALGAAYALRRKASS